MKLKKADGDVRVSRHMAVALTGASGPQYFLRLLERLRGISGLTVHLLATDGGIRVLREETGLKWSELDLDSFEIHANKNIGASLASGSFALESLVVVPCSMNTLAALAAGLAANLVQRCAAVQLKESRRLILVPRETPLSLIHLRAMVSLREAGAVILPASPGFYHRPRTIEDLVDTVVDRILDQAGIHDRRIKRWNP